MPCRIFPSDFELNQDAQSSVALSREIQTLRTMASGLTEAYCVFHSVHWTRLIDPKSRALGEIDFVVMNRAGELLLIEQKTGPLIESNGELWKSYSHQHAPKSVTSQLFRNQDGLLTKFRKVHNALLKTTNVLYCPDYKVIEVKTSGLDRNQIIDSTESDLFCQKLMKLLPEGQTNQHTKAIERFLKNELLIQEDLVKISCAQQQLTTRIAGGLSDWVHRLHLDPYRLRVQGTAGSGKTQLAIRELRTAIEQGAKALYVSFNRPLAQHMGEIFEGLAKTTSFFTFCEELIRTEDAQLANKPGFITESIDELFELASAIEPMPAQQYDVVVIDEGQDFSQAQADFLVSWAKPNGKVFWLEDPLQNIYFKLPVKLPCWAALKAPVNYRNPKPIAEFLAELANRILPGSGDELINANPVEGPHIQLVDYPQGNITGLKSATESALADLLAQGFKPSQITILSFKGQAKSEILKLTALNGYALNTPSNSPLKTASAAGIETDTLFRYKGLSNLAVILTEVDFEALNERTARLLFVGASRAKLALSIVRSAHLKALWPSIPAPQLHSKG